MAAASCREVGAPRSSAPPSQKPPGSAKDVDGGRGLHSPGRGRFPRRPGPEPVGRPRPRR